MIERARCDAEANFGAPQYRCVARAIASLYRDASFMEPNIMKVTVNIDCTPIEARQFMGLPDVEPMQKAIMESVQARMMKEFETYTSEKFVDSWMPMLSLNRDWMLSMFGAFTKGASGANKGTSSAKKGASGAASESDKS